VALILGLISIAAFMAYFYAIWFWYVGFIPLLVFVISIIYYISGISFKSRWKNILQKYGLFLARIVVMLWLFGVLKFFDISNLDTSLFLIALNVLLRILSYLFKYNDWKSIAQVWYYTAVIWLLSFIWVSYGFSSFFSAFTMLWALSLAVISFITFVVWIKYEIENYMKYALFVFLLGSLWLSLYSKVENIYIFLLISVVALGLLYAYIYHILSHKPPTENEVKEISVRRILAWERVLKDASSDRIWSHKIYTFVNDAPLMVRYFLEWVNIVVILMLIYLYFQNALALQWSIEQIFYWLITAGFVTNVFLLKKIDYTSIAQRLLTFVVINFAIYISLFSAFQWDIWRIVFLWIVRNIFCAMMVFHAHKTKVWIYLKKIDYLFWIFTTILALIVNVVLLVQTEIVGQLLFPIILLYVWVQGMVLFYSIKYVNKIQEVHIID